MITLMLHELLLEGHAESLVFDGQADWLEACGTSLLLFWSWKLWAPAALESAYTVYIFVFCSSAV